MKFALSISKKGLNEILKLHNQKAKNELKNINSLFRDYLESKLDGVTEANPRLHFELSDYETKSGNAEIIEIFGTEYFEWSRVAEVST